MSLDDHITPQLYKDGTMTPDMFSVEQARFAVRLWKSMAIGSGTWTLPGVGKYRRTGDTTLTLIEIHAGNPVNAVLGNVFDRHDFIVKFANQVGWIVYENVEKAYDAEKVELNVPNEEIGRVAVCSADCGTVIRIEPVDVWKRFHKIEEGVCPVCLDDGFSDDWNGIHVVIDEKSVMLRRKQVEEEE